MQYPDLPLELNSQPEIRLCLGFVDSESRHFSEDVSAQISGDSLSVELAGYYLDRFVWLTAILDRAQDAIAQTSTFDDGETGEPEAIVAEYDPVRDFVESMTQLLFDELKDDGADAQLLLEQAQIKHLGATPERAPARGPIEALASLLKKDQS